MTDTAQKRVRRNSLRRLTKRGVVKCEVPDEPLKKGSIVASLRRSPLVGANLDLARSRDPDG